MSTSPNWRVIHALVSPFVSFLLCLSMPHSLSELKKLLRRITVLHSMNWKLDDSCSIIVLIQPLHSICSLDILSPCAPCSILACRLTSSFYVTLDSDWTLCMCDRTDTLPCSKCYYFNWYLLFCLSFLPPFQICQVVHILCPWFTPSFALFIRSPVSFFSMWPHCLQFSSPRLRR